MNSPSALEDAVAVLRLLAIKQREVGKGLTLFAGAHAQRDRLLDWNALPAGRRDAVLANWPGPNTWIVPATPRMPGWVTGDPTGVAARVSAHPVVVALTAARGGPLVSTSANLGGQPPAFARAELDPMLLARIDALAPGETGGLAPPSRIRDAAPARYCARDGVAPAATDRNVGLNARATSTPPRLSPRRRRGQTRRMHGQPSSWALLALLLVSAASHAADVTIYRCTDERGRQTLRDSPCLKGERQQARTMLRPQDPPARAATAPKAAASPAPAAAPTRIVVVTPARPMYECLTPDGARYLSDTDRGELRWQPVWAYGYRLHGSTGRFDHGRRGLPQVARPRTLDGRLPSGLVFDSVGRPAPKPSGDRPAAPLRPQPRLHGGGFPGIFSSGGWVEDYCQPLPQAEVCARLRDRRYALDRRYHSALQGERTQISQEQRGIDARLASDCGG